MPRFLEQAEGITEILRFMCRPHSSAGSRTHCSGSLTKPARAFAVLFAFPSPTPFWASPTKVRGHRSLRERDRGNIRRQPIRLRRIGANASPKGAGQRRGPRRPGSRVAATLRDQGSGSRRLGPFSIPRVRRKVGSGASKVACEFELTAQSVPESSTLRKFVQICQ